MTSAIGGLKRRIQQPYTAHLCARYYVDADRRALTCPRTRTGVYGPIEGQDWAGSQARSVTATSCRRRKKRDFLRDPRHVSSLRSAARQPELLHVPPHFRNISHAS